MSATIDPKIIGKIKKCLALSASSNPNEAATALRQARLLMEKHGIDAHQIAMAEIAETTADSHTLSRGKAAQWETAIASIVGRAFGCQLMFLKDYKVLRSGKIKMVGSFIFVGLRQQAEIASYTATVLIRRCKKARQEWIATNFKGLSVGVAGAKKKISNMGDAFALGWAHEINKLVSDFALSSEVEEAIKKHIHDRSNGGKEAAVRKPTQDADGTFALAARAGIEAAKGERLYRPMAGAEERGRLGSSCAQ
jgi:hypothetical protein